MVGPSSFRFVTVHTGTVPVFAAPRASLSNSPPFPPKKWDGPPRVERRRLSAAPRERLLRFLVTGIVPLRLALIGTGSAGAETPRVLPKGGPAEWLAVEPARMLNAWLAEQVGEALDRRLARVETVFQDADVAGYQRGVVLWVDGVGKDSVLDAAERVDGWLGQGLAVCAVALRGYGETATRPRRYQAVTEAMGPNRAEAFIAYMLGRSLMGLRAADLLQTAVRAGRPFRRPGELGRTVPWSCPRRTKPRKRRPRRFEGLRFA